METTDIQDKARSIAKANDYLRNPEGIKPEDTESIWALAKTLIKSDELGWGRRLLDMLAELDRYPAGSKEQFTQKRALATYKDPDLNRNEALTSR